MVVLGCFPTLWLPSKRGAHDCNHRKIYSSCAIGKQIDKDKVFNRADGFWYEPCCGWHVLLSNDLQGRLNFHVNYICEASNLEHL